MWQNPYSTNYNPMAGFQAPPFQSLLLWISFSDMVSAQTTENALN